MTDIRHRRWGDNDHNFGPFTYARDKEGYRPLAVVLGSGDGDEHKACTLRVSGFGHTFIAVLPSIVKPHRIKVLADSWDAATVTRLGRNWYWNQTEREFGFSLSDGFLQVMFGRQSHDSSTERNWSYFLPWTQWRHVRRSLYDLRGNHFWTEPERGPGEPWDCEAIRAVEESCPSASFAFDDFDGERLTALTRIEEREWRFGTGCFKWLSLFRRPKICRSLDISFSGETGKRKGSWKGGTTGTGVQMLPGETHAAAFRRYCAEHKMTFCAGLSSVA